MPESTRDLLIRVANDLTGCADQLGRLALTRPEPKRYELTAERDHIRCSVSLLRHEAEKLSEAV